MSSIASVVSLFISLTHNVYTLLLQGGGVTSPTRNSRQSSASKRRRNSPPAADVIDLTTESSQPDDFEIISCTVVSEPNKRSRVVSSVNDTGERRLLKALQDRYGIVVEDTEEKAASPRGPNCGICMEKMGGDTSRPMYAGPCGHIYCKSCLVQAVQKTKKCPTCRKNLATKQLHQVFLNFDC